MGRETALQPMKDHDHLRNQEKNTREFTIFFQSGDPEVFWSDAQEFSNPEGIRRTLQDQRTDARFQRFIHGNVGLAFRPIHQ